MTLPKFSRALLISTLSAGVVLLLLTLVIVLRPPARAPGTPLPKLVKVWGWFVSFQDGGLTMTVAQPPEQSGDAVSDLARVGDPLTVAVPAGLPAQLEYYKGDIITGTLVLAEPFDVRTLRSKALLKITAQISPGGILSAKSVTWLQSTTPPTAVPSAEATPTTLRVNEPILRPPVPPP